MIILAGVFGATWFVSTALAAHLPRLLEAMGATPAAAIAAGALVGPAQVAARVAEFSLLRHAAPMISARLAAGLHPTRGGAARADRRAGRHPLRAAARRRQRHADDRARHVAARSCSALPATGCAPACSPHRPAFSRAARRLLFGLVLDRGGPLAALLLTGSLTGLSLLALLLLQPSRR